MLLGTFSLVSTDAAGGWPNAAGEKTSKDIKLATEGIKLTSDADNMRLSIGIWFRENITILNFSLAW
jgi:hypothetical protein